MWYGRETLVKMCALEHMDLKTRPVVHTVGRTGSEQDTLQQKAAQLAHHPSVMVSVGVAYTEC